MNKPRDLIDINTESHAEFLIARALCREIDKAWLQVCEYGRRLPHLSDIAIETHRNQVIKLCCDLANDNASTCAKLLFIMDPAAGAPRCDIMAAIQTRVTYSTSTVVEHHLQRLSKYP